MIRRPPLQKSVTPDTLHFGEAYLAVDDGQGGVAWSNRVAPPHVWEGVLFYLAAMALSNPERFDADTRELPLPEDAGCGCTGTSRSAEFFLILLALAAFARPRRSRRLRPVRR